jgi:hypothetical protein
VLYEALGALAYYTMETNPLLVTEARRWLVEVIADQPTVVAAECALGDVVHTRLVVLGRQK